MLTTEEREHLIEKLKTYPAGTPARAWGYGDMQEEADHDDTAEDSIEYYEPSYFNREQLAEFG